MIQNSKDNQGVFAATSSFMLDHPILMLPDDCESMKLEVAVNKP